MQSEGGRKWLPGANLWKGQQGRKAGKARNLLEAGCRYKVWCNAGLQPAEYWLGEKREKRRSKEDKTGLAKKWDMGKKKKRLRLGDRKSNGLRMLSVTRSSAPSKERLSWNKIFLHLVLEENCKSYLNSQELGEMPSHEKRKWKLSPRTIKHINLIQWDSGSIDGVDRKAVWSPEGLEIMHLVVKGQLNILHCVLVIPYFSMVKYFVLFQKAPQNNIWQGRITTENSELCYGGS